MALARSASHQGGGNGGGNGGGVAGNGAASPSPLPPGSVTTPYFLENFYGDGDLGQCNGAFYGAQGVALDDWTAAIRMDTDNRPGGCLQQFGIYDPTSALAGLDLTVDFEPDPGAVGQCDNPGARVVPITNVPPALWSSVYRIDTDDRPGGCQQTFSISGRNDVALDVDFEADGDPGQCGNTGTHTVTEGNPVTLHLDMDSRPGGCRQSFRLRQTTCGGTGQECCPGAACGAGASCSLDGPWAPAAVGYWRFDDCTAGGTAVHDYSGNNYDGTKNATTACAPGFSGLAGAFDGSSSAVQIPDEPAFHMTTAMTVAAWVDPTSVSGLHTILNKWYGPDSYMLLVQDGQYVFTIVAGGTYYSVTAPATAGAWTHVAGVYDSNAGEISLYVNGSLAAQKAASGAIAPSSQPVCIGNCPSWNAFAGSIDEVWLGNVALSQTQIQHLSLPAVGYWRFDDCTGGSTALADSSGNGYTAQKSGGVACGTGFEGLGGSFDGSSGMVQVTDEPDFHLTTSMTAAAWVNPTSVSGLHTILNKWYAPDSYMLLIQNGQYVFTIVAGGTYYTVTAPASVGSWTHVAGVYDGAAGVARLYVNGSLAGTTPASGTLQASSQPLCIGDCPSWNAFAGSIDEVWLGNEALSQTQVQQLAGECLACGGVGEACCGGTSCGAGGTCQAGTCVACGAVGEACCPGNSCGPGGVCAGGTCACGGSSNGIAYHGGPVMPSNPVSVYFVWYGNWGGNSATSILPDLIPALSGSPYEHINTTYCVAGTMALEGQVSDSYSQGTSLTDATMQAIVENQIGGGALPEDPNGVYFVLTSADVTSTYGIYSYCTLYCGYHSSYVRGDGADIKYAFVGDPSSLCPMNCEVQTASSPNGNPGADGMASVMAHESEEAISDPDATAWYDSSGNENADKCQWTFGTVSTAGNGSLYNFTGNGREWLIQQNWVNASGGYCAMHYP